MMSMVKQDLGQTWLILHEAVPCKEDYRYHMLLSNHIRGLLPCSVRSLDREVKFYYDISGKQNLLEELKQNKLNHSTLRNLLTQLLELETEMRDYLLRLDAVLLDPAYIYYERHTFFFIYLPTAEAEPTLALHELIATLMEYVDYRDTKVVELLYTLHSKTRGVYNLQNVVREITEAQYGLRQDISEEPMDAGEEIRDEKPKKEKTKKEKSKIEKSYSLSLRKKETSRSRRRKKKPDKESGSLWEDVFLENRTGWLSEALFEEDPETTYLEYQAAKVQGLLLQSEDGRDRIAIRDTPFFIGSDPDQAEGYIASPLVSHVHARVETVAGISFLEDLSSKNGTFLNGRRLDSGERVRLGHGDRIRFANLEYKVTAIKNQQQS